MLQVTMQHVVQGIAPAPFLGTVLVFVALDWGVIVHYCRGTIEANVAVLTKILY